MKCDAIFFDLDGTLWDAAAASAHGWNLALAKLGVSRRVTVDDIRSVSGTPFHQCVATLLPELSTASEATIHLLDEHERYGIEMIGGVLYDGVEDGLALLAVRYPLFLVSNCPDWYLEAFFRITGLRDRFVGSDCHGTSGLHKADMLRRLCGERGFGSAIYVGDTQGDRDAAEAAGMTFAFAGYGFGRTIAPKLCVTEFSDLITQFL